MAVPASTDGPESKAETVISQRDYKPTPFQTTRWETIGVRMSEATKRFALTEFEILTQGAFAVDPMFEMFDQDVARGASYPWQEAAGPAAVAEGFVQQEVVQKLSEQRFEEGKKLGYEQGLAEAERLTGEKKAQLAEQLRNVTDTIQQTVKETLRQMEEEALKLALSISRKILQTTVELKPEYIIDVIRQGLVASGAAQPLRIRVSAQDYEFLEVVGLPPELSREELGVQYVADEAVKSGCVIETDFGEIDLRLEEMWEKIKSQLYETMK